MNEDNRKRCEAYHRKRSNLNSPKNPKVTLHSSPTCYVTIPFRSCPLLCVLQAPHATSHDHVEGNRWLLLAIAAEMEAMTRDQRADKTTPKAATDADC
jgi:hypothetical protein